MKQSWLTIIGFGCDGLEGLGDHAKALVENAEVLVGGDRHLDMVENVTAERISWGRPFNDKVEQLKERKGKRIVVLASGDPMCYGVGMTFTRRLENHEFTVIPAPSSYSLACARLKWHLPEVACITLHGRPLETINAYLQPGRKILALCWDGTTPAKVAESLAARGFGKSKLVTLEEMGGNLEMITQGEAETWNRAAVGDLVTLAVEVAADETAALYSPAPGLPDEAFESDGQLTKREVRAVTLSSLAPLPGQTLWDVGAGSGSIAIEWMRSHPSNKAYAIEHNAKRADFCRRNALALGTPKLNVVEGEALDALDDLPNPDAIFVGGNVRDSSLLALCWGRLPKGGVLVANAVTVEAERSILDFHQSHGGTLTRLAVSRAEEVGTLLGWRAMMPVTQLKVIKP